MNKTRTQQIDAITLSIAQFKFGAAGLTEALMAARNNVVDMLALEIEHGDTDAADTLDLALDCLEFAVDYSREEPTQDAVAEYESAVADVIHTLRNSFLH